MAVSPEFRSEVIRALSAHGDIRDKSMFGGVGLYASERFFAVLDNDRIYFKVDDKTRPDYQERGMGPFMPTGDPDAAMNGYYELPPESWMMTRN
jgi:DNA transformation protein